MKPILLVSLLISTSTLKAQTDSSSVPKADSGIFQLHLIRDAEADSA